MPAKENKNVIKWQLYSNTGRQKGQISSKHPVLICWCWMSNTHRDTKPFTTSNIHNNNFIVIRFLLEHNKKKNFFDALYPLYYPYLFPYFSRKVSPITHLFMHPVFLWLKCFHHHNSNIVISISLYEGIYQRLCYEWQQCILYEVECVTVRVHSLFVAISRSKNKSTNDNWRSDK